ncbi:hypothetical protein A2U01_0037911, partial [Trifolium medium]|nr:hypothetical protein [Trifolium medium]
MREMQLHLETLSKQHETFQSFITTQLSTIITTTHPSSSSSSPTPSPFKPPKIHLPPFDGSNPLDWIFQADQYFDLAQISPTQRMQFLPFFMKGDAL